MVSDRARVILFWFTIGMIILVAAVAVVTILRGCSGPSSTEPPLSVFPAEITLCVGEQQQFTAGDDAEVTWDASGGTISESGAFTASEPGDYTVTAARSGTRRKAEAVAHVTACTPTPTPMPSPTPAPTPTPTAVPPTAPPPADPSGDVVAYEGGTPVEQVPAGSDIRAASLGQDLSVDLQPGEQIPDELATWAAEGELLLWMSFHGPIPDPPSYTDWLFASFPYLTK